MKEFKVDEDQNVEVDLMEILMEALIKYQRYFRKK